MSIVNRAGVDGILSAFLFEVPIKSQGLLSEVSTCSGRGTTSWSVGSLNLRGCLTTSLDPERQSMSPWSVEQAQEDNVFKLVKAHRVVIWKLSPAERRGCESWQAIVEIERDVKHLRT